MHGRGFCEFCGQRGGPCAVCSGYDDDLPHDDSGAVVFWLAVVCLAVIALVTLAGCWLIG